MFIRKSTYQALQEIIIDQNQTIDTLNSYIALLKKEIRVYKQCLRISVPDNDIDFQTHRKEVLKVVISSQCNLKAT